ncbi:MAG: C4-type zinc ribbon domain-containing protein [Microthrixaceae bacterium]
MAALDDLLVVQELDTAIDQLQHRRATLPVLGSLEQVGLRTAEVSAVRDEVAGRLHRVRADQKEAEDHAALIEDKARTVDVSMYDGSIVAHKELESLQEELAQLRHRQGEYEDRALELMEQAEPIEEELAERDGLLAELRVERDGLDSQLIVENAEIDAELDRLVAERAAAVGSVPDDLMAAYEPLRSSLGGVAVARLLGSRCEGCHLEIPSAELEEVRRAPEDALVHCPECMRILVR